jgi:hypothetical protein
MSEGRAIQGKETQMARSSSGGSRKTASTSRSSKSQSRSSKSRTTSSSSKDRTHKRTSTTSNGRGKQSKSGSNAAGKGIPDYTIIDPEQIEEAVDVYVDVPVVQVEEIKFEMDDLRAHLAVLAEAGHFVQLNAGASVRLGKVELDIQGVEAQVLLEARLHNVTAILARVLTSLDRNPQLLKSVGEALGDVGSGAHGLLEDTGDTVKDVGKGADSALQDVGKGAGKGVAQIGQGAGQGVEGLGQGAGQGVQDIGQGAGQGVEGLGQGAGQGVQDIGQGAGQGVQNLAKGGDS